MSSQVATSSTGAGGLAFSACYSASFPSDLDLDLAARRRLSHFGVSRLAAAPAHSHLLPPPSLCIGGRGIAAPFSLAFRFRSNSAYSSIDPHPVTTSGIDIRDDRGA